MDTILILIKIFLSIAAGMIAGFSTIYVFNRIPAKWLCDYKQEPSKEMWDERIKKTPWTAAFVLVFTAASLKLLDQGFLYTLPAIVTLWLLLQIGMADKKYMIIPDQFVIALVVTSLGFIPFHPDYISMLLGAATGGGSILMMGLIGNLIFGKESMGFGDVKLFAAVGLICGLKGVIIILLLTIFSSALVFGFGLLSGKLKSGDEQPLGPFIAAATALYILFSSEFELYANLYLNF